jgi:hypothetical protein
MKQIALYLVKAIHLSYSMVALFGPLFIDDPLLLSIILFCIVLNYYFWASINMCILTKLEEYLGEESRVYENNRKKSFITNIIENCTGLDDMTIGDIITILPTLSASVILYKLNKDRLFPLPIPEITTTTQL